MPSRPMPEPLEREYFMRECLDNALDCIKSLTACQGQLLEVVLFLCLRVSGLFCDFGDLFPNGM